MKHSLFFLMLAFLVSCQKEEEFMYDYPEPDKLLVSVTRTGENTTFRTEFTYDSLNRLVEVKNIVPEAQTTIESYVYNPQGKVVEKTVGNHTTTYSYNTAGQLEEQTILYTSPDSDYEWSERTKYQYKNGKISKGIVYKKNGEIQQTVRYKYDSRGNTLEKTVHPTGSASDIALVEIKFRYDTKPNPLGNSGVNLLNGHTFNQHADIKQVNNPVYSSYLNMVSSSFPPEFEISYEYDADGYPVKAVMKGVRIPDQEPMDLVYEYREMEKQ